jgi:hypothetical protein
VSPVSTVRKLWPLGWVREIPREGGRYLTRVSLREQRPTGGGGWRVYLHRFWATDTELHNHPWRWSFSIILWGSYTETYADLVECPLRGAAVLGAVRTRRVRWFNWIPETRFHQIKELHGPVVTLFFSGPLHRKSWGFWVPGRGLVHHKVRKAERGLPVL